MSIHDRHHHAVVTIERRGVVRRVKFSFNLRELLDAQATPRAHLGSRSTRPIPPSVLDRGERAFVNVLRRRHPNAVFIVRDIQGEGAVAPLDADVPGEITGGTAADNDRTEEPG